MEMSNLKLTYLGTAAAEGFPAVFCNCEYCVEAKRLKGKNIRTRSQSIVNDDLLIDLPADTYSHLLNNNIDGDKIKYLLITHSHQDHFYPEELAMRYGAFAHNMRCEKIKVYCNRGAEEKIHNNSEVKNPGVEIYILNPFDTIEMGEYTVTALPARHFEGDDALFYIIKQGDKKILYAHDTGYFYDDVFDYIKENKIYFDLISLDCTNIDIPISDTGSHMGIENIERLIKKLEEIGAVGYETKKVINHFSHNAAPIHHKLEERVKHLGYIVSYDGINIEVD